MLGRKEIYERRSVKANCYNGLDYERMITTVDCGCERSDYLCDFGFKRDSSWSEACVKDDESYATHDPYLPPAHCPPHTFYNQTRGYLKIRGDTCQGGNAARYEPQRVGCPLAVEKDFMLIAQRTKIVRIDLRDTNNVEVFPLNKNVIKNAIALEYDVEDDCLFYGDIVLDRIFMYCNQNGTTDVIVDDNQSVEGMAYDWISKALYFVDGEKPTIEVVQIGHRGVRNGEIGHRWRRVVLDKRSGISKPRGIAVYPQHGYLYYSDWDEKNPHIGRAGMDGSNPVQLFKKPLVQWPNGLSIDYVANRVYWVDGQKDIIASCDLDGHDFKSVLSNNPHVKHPFAVGIHKDLMYWDDWNTKSVYFANKNSGRGIVEIQTNMAGSMDLKVFTKLHRTGTTACRSNPCSHLCAPIPDGKKYTCLCPDGKNCYFKVETLPFTDIFFYLQA